MGWLREGVQHWLAGLRAERRGEMAASDWLNPPWLGEAWRGSAAEASARRRSLHFPAEPPVRVPRPRPRPAEVNRGRREGLGPPRLCACAGEAAVKWPRRSEAGGSERGLGAVDSSGGGSRGAAAGASCGEQGASPPLPAPTQSACGQDAERNLD